jgi:hypothetical protein
MEFPIYLKIRFLKRESTSNRNTYAIVGNATIFDGLKNVKLQKINFDIILSEFSKMGFFIKTAKDSQRYRGKRKKTYVAPSCYIS